MISDESADLIGILIGAAMNSSADDGRTEFHQRCARARDEFTTLLDAHRRRDEQQARIDRVVADSYDRCLRFADEAMQSPQGITSVAWQQAMHAFLRAGALQGASRGAAVDAVRLEAMLAMVTGPRMWR